MEKKLSKLEKAKKDAFSSSKQIVKKDYRIFEGDLLKHLIRTDYWETQIKNLKRARGCKNINYFSLCAETALDARLFIKDGHIDRSLSTTPPFVFCEYDEEKYNMLKDDFPNPCDGFCGKLEDIATNVKNPNYGKFWGTFPFDVINLDFWGDIHKGDDVNQNIFYLIQAILFQQAHLREQYELWITWRVKDDRIMPSIKYAYQSLIKMNYERGDKTFNQMLDRVLAEKGNIDTLSEENLVNIGFIKWILYAVNRSFSVILPKQSKILYYSRKDKGNETYKIFNFLLRINPYRSVDIPSPACAAAIHCEKEYKNNLFLCFEDPIDIDKEFKNLTKVEKTKLHNSLDELMREYDANRKGSMI